MGNPSILLLLPAALAACAPACTVPGTPQLTAQLFLGGNVPDTAWQDFLAAEITPRFPDGLSVLAADGQWRTPDGRQIREHARLLLIVMARDQKNIAAIEAVADRYKQKFDQQSVGIVYSDVCAAF